MTNFGVDSQDLYDIAKTELKSRGNVMPVLGGSRGGCTNEDAHLRARGGALTVQQPGLTVFLRKIADIMEKHPEMDFPTAAAAYFGGASSGGKKPRKSKSGGGTDPLGSGGSRGGKLIGAAVSGGLAGKSTAKERQIAKIEKIAQSIVARSNPVPQKKERKRKGGKIVPVVRSQGGSNDGNEGGSAKQKKAAKENPWIAHIRAYRVKHPKLSYREAMVAARKSYKG